jgi:predicted nucleic acid-binding Zn ribbon protein
MMDSDKLAALEEAIKPYRQSGFIVTSQSEGAITLSLPQEKFSYLFFIFTLILLWPVAVVYLVSFNNQRGKSVCLRITAQGYIEASGYTLEVIKRNHRRRRIITLLLFSVLAVVILFILIRVYLSRMQ